MIEETASEKEIKEAVKEIRDSVPGEDGIRINYIRKRRTSG